MTDGSKNTHTTGIPLVTAAKQIRDKPYWERLSLAEKFILGLAYSLEKEVSAQQPPYDLTKLLKKDSSPQRPQRSNG